MLDKKLLIMPGIHPVIAVNAFQFFDDGKSVGDKSGACTYVGTGPDLIRYTLHIHQTKTQYVVDLIQSES